MDEDLDILQWVFSGGVLAAVWKGIHSVWTVSAAVTRMEVGLEQTTDAMERLADAIEENREILDRHTVQISRIEDRLNAR